MGVEKDINLIHGDCLEKMKDIPNESIDMILCDLPYGTTNCEWDVKIDLVQLWKEYKRIIKEHGTIVLFSQLPFTCELIADAAVPFRYEWIWRKTQGAGFLNSRKMPLRAHESILVFYKHLPTYNPQMRAGKPYVNVHKKDKTSAIYAGDIGCKTVNNGDRYPIDVITFENHNSKSKKHPTEKPVSLLKYLIKTYTNPGETVLDNTMGSGSTGVACVNIGRKFIGIELDDHYYDVAVERINAAKEEHEQS